ncbi:MAG TPA: hypothetical protein VJK73_00770 [Candidatus Paceibacterota bacterium]
MSGFLKLIIILAVVAAGIIGALIILDIGTVNESQLMLEKILGILGIVAVVGIVSMLLMRQ